MIASNHARDRINERLGLPKKSAAKNAAVALEHGVSHKEATGRLRKYIAYLYLSHGKAASNIRIYGNHVYIFAGSRLITVLPLPNAHKNAAAKIIKRRDRRLKDNQN